VLCLDLCLSLFRLSSLFSLSLLLCACVLVRDGRCVSLKTDDEADDDDVLGADRMS